ncbi:31637_t:CDS:2 [Gigaspora margarita]|uniref:31637_t:CDS:1 n=1 Tax=Gigaspora margarita TaxID=4874 RepID=A0ABN7UIE5_GIGMA|nr:31637_t:CDS:2 [Gigaspora margarita]
MLQTQVTDKQEINVDLIKAFTKADIPLEKVEKLKSFLQKYCANDDLDFYQTRNIPIAPSVSLRIQQM